MIEALADLHPLSPSLTRDNAGRPAREMKFLLRAELAAVVAGWMRARLAPDPYAAGIHGDEYATSTLYLDTPGLDILRRNPAAGLSKWRIRRYGRDGVVFLERKLRAEGLLMKRRVAISGNELERLGSDELGTEWSGDWFHRRMLGKTLRPVCLVSYDRIARIADTRDGSIRMTLDTGLRYAPANGLGFEGARYRPLSESHAILELKFTDTIPSLFKPLLEALPLTPVRLSKYRAAGTLLHSGITF